MTNSAGEPIPRQLMTPDELIWYTLRYGEPKVRIVFREVDDQTLYLITDKREEDVNWDE